MSAIKTITATMIRSILVDDFNVGVLVADADRRKELANIAPDEIDELVSRLNDVKAYIATAQEERRNEALQLLQGLLTEQSMFETVEELVEAVSGSAPVTRLRTVIRGSSNNNNKSFTVVIGQKSYSVINKQIPAGLRDNEAYQTLLKSRPEMENVDNFLREYSTDYQAAYPINAVWNGKKFHINSRGKLNEVSQSYFEEFKKKDKTGADDRTLLAKFKAKVMEDFTK